MNTKWVQQWIRAPSIHLGFLSFKYFYCLTLMDEYYVGPVVDLWALGNLLGFFYLLSVF
jgi:hypothetical protein